MGLAVDKGDLDRAETRHLEFKVASAPLSERLERFGAELSDLILQYARIAGRPLTIWTGGPVRERPLLSASA
jgi:hypothetical protein